MSFNESIQALDHQRLQDVTGQVVARIYPDDGSLQPDMEYLHTSEDVDLGSILAAMNTDQEGILFRQYGPEQRGLIFEGARIAILALTEYAATEEPQ
jgi:hypothetical protein